MNMLQLKQMLLAGAALVFLVPVATLGAEKEAQTIDELVAMYDETSCMECHKEIHDQWQDSWHAKAVVSSLGGLHNFTEIGLKKEWETPLTKSELM